MPNAEVIAWLESETGQAWSREKHARTIVSWFQLKNDDGYPEVLHFWDYAEFDENPPAPLVLQLV